ncbi:Ribose operon repressor [Companilactobacillus paralimentarius]
MMKAKIDDVAKLAGVSKTTVSRVMNKRGYLSDKTIKKVHDAMDELNYHPNVVARQLFKQETKLVGLIFPTVNNPFFGQLVSEMEKRLFNLGFKVLIGDSMNDPKKEKLYLQELMTHQVDGLIVGAHNQGIEEYKNTNLPIVAIDRIMNKDIPVVSSDNYLGGQLATQLLIDNGAKIIIHTNDPQNIKSPAQKRRSAYEDTMIKNGLKPIVYTLDFDSNTDTKINSIKKIFKEHPDVDGLFISNDMDAAQVIDVARGLGYKIPEDLKVVGYDGADVTKVLLPNLTTVVQPIDKMAEVAVNTLVERMKNDSYDSNRVLPVKIWRGKTV